MSLDRPAPVAGHRGAKSPFKQNAFGDAVSTGRARRPPPL
jgi:hypothetical protein